MRINNCVKRVFITYTSSWLFMGFENWKYQLFSDNAYCTCPLCINRNVRFYLCVFPSNWWKKIKEKNVKRKTKNQYNLPVSLYEFLFKNHLLQHFKVEKSKHNNCSIIEHTSHNIIILYKSYNLAVELFFRDRHIWKPNGYNIIV